MSIRVTGIYRYPVKSCRGERLDASAVDPWGLAGDRRWMIVDADGSPVTGREYPRLVLVAPSVDTSNVDNSNRVMRFTAPGMPDLTVGFPGGGESRLVPVNVWKKSSLVAAQADDEASEWLTKITGDPVRLVYLDDPTRRRVDPDYSLDTDRVSFADGFPLLMVSEASLARLNDWIAEGPNPDAAPLPVARFRPNVVISGASPWQEDEWRSIRIGDVTFRSPKGSDRCVFTTVDPDTAVKGREPLVTLARHRRWAGKVWFGVNLIPDAPGTISAGDVVEITA
ncbi:MAG: MOSC domain-containing protein [Trebonia sp.]